MDPAALAAGHYHLPFYWLTSLFRTTVLTFYIHTAEPEFLG